MRFLKSKNFWLIIITLIIIGILIYFIFSKDSILEIIEDNIAPPSDGQAEEKKDEIAPASQIKSPNSGSWHGRGFVLKVLDEDLGGSGLDYCEYKIITYDNGKEYSTGWLNRKCNSDLLISVGEMEMCAFEGENACWIYMRSTDKDNNQHIPSLKSKSIIYLNIDWDKPVVGKVFATDAQEEQIYPINIEEKKQYNLRTNISDNFKITGCNLYINNENYGTMSVLNPGCAEECMFSKEFIPEQTGSYQIFAACKDAAGNISKSETIEAKTNLPPKISSCTVIPTSGDISTQFNFSVDAQDPDNDSLSFSWDFGDGEFSNVKNAVHSYENPGTYEPEITVSDGKGASDSCSTAWVSVF